jgi:hypothetical protein
MDIDKIINIIREQNLKVGRKLPADLRMGGGGGGTNVLTSQPKVRTMRQILLDPSGKGDERRFKNDPQTKLDEDMGAGAVSGPTNNVGDGKIAGTVQAGDDPPVDPKKGKKKYIYFKGVRKNWKL